MVAAKGCPLNPVCVSMLAGSEASYIIVVSVNLDFKLEPWV